MIMSTGRVEYQHQDLTGQIIGEFYTVYNTLGFGFLEKIYENSLAMRLRKAGMEVHQQQPIKVYFEGAVVGSYYADMVVNDVVILEIKTVRKLLEEHHAQLINYLKATKYEVGLLLNFGPTPKVVRKAYDNHRKRPLAP